MSDPGGARPPDAGTRAATLLGRVAVALVAIAIVVVLSIAFDARVAFAARTLPPDAVAWGRLLSTIGLSGWMFALSGLLACGAFAARRLPSASRDTTALTALAERSAYVFATLAVTGLAAQLVKHLVGRARPTLFAEVGPYDFELLSLKNALASFPSGHTTNAFAMAIALSYFAPRLRVPLFALAAAIAASRIVVQAHYVSDIAAGAMLGSALAIALASFFARRDIAFTRGPDGPHVKNQGAVAAAVFRRTGSQP